MASKVGSVFITGANRGLGFTLLKQILDQFKPKNVFATYRSESSAKDLIELAASNKNLHLIQIELVDYDKHAEVAKQVEAVVGDAGLNLLINNAGILLNDTLKDVTLERLRENMEVNLYAPLLLTKALLPLLEKASAQAGSAPWGINRAAVINYSSLLGSVAKNENGGMYPYRCSKAALNMATKSLSVELAPQKIVSIVLHPGWVQTDMGGKNAHLTVEQSISGIMKVLENLKESDNGRFIQWNGEDMDW